MNGLPVCVDRGMHGEVELYDTRRNVRQLFLIKHQAAFSIHCEACIGMQYTSL